MRALLRRERPTLHALLAGLLMTAAPVVVARQVALRDQLLADINGG